MEMLSPFLDKKTMDMFTPLIHLMEGVMKEEEEYEVLQTDLRPMNNLVLNIGTLFPDQRKEDQEVLKIWLQLLRNCLTDGCNLLHRYGPSQRQRRLDFVNCRPGRLLKRLKEWKLHFDYIFQGLQSDFSMFVDQADQMLNRDPTLSAEEAAEELEEESGDPTRSAEEAVEELEEESGDPGWSAEESGVPSRSAEELEEESGDPTLSSEEAAEELEESGDPTRSAEEPVEEAVEELEEEPVEEAVEEESGVPPRSAEELEEESGDPTLSAEEAAEEESGDPTRSAEESVEELEEESGERLCKRLCEDEAWMVFERIAFREKGAPVDIKGCARNIAEECKGFPLAIRLVAAAMRGKTTVDEWNISLSSIKNSSSYPQATLHPQRLYQLLRWCYDALPNSHIKNCFLYCAMYPKGYRIKVQELVRMWIGEGLVRSKQENHSMDMAIGWKYLNLLLDRCFFQTSDPSEDYYSISHFYLRELQCIRVEDDIHEMAIYIGEKEENCLLKAGRGLQNFPTIHNHADCKRISLLDNDDIRNLPSELPCPKLVSLILSSEKIEEVPSGFLVSLTSLKVLKLHGHWSINSIPSSVGQLKQLEFLSLHGFFHIKELPEEMCHLPFLQFLDLFSCSSLESLPSKIGELQNLKYLNLTYCGSLKEIPHEFSQLTSLTTLDLEGVKLSVEADQSEAISIWWLKGFTNLRELSLGVHGGVAEGIMGTWLEMRHLSLFNAATHLPRDMKEMRKLQSFDLNGYEGSSLPDYACNFRHLENICLSYCCNLREVSPLERLPNLKCLTLHYCRGLKELGIGSSGRGSRFLMLEKLLLCGLRELESIAGASSSNESVWNESTLPSLRILKIGGCRKLKRFPVGMDRLLNLNTIYGEQEWWDQIIWEDDAMKAQLQKLFQRLSY